MPTSGTRAPARGAGTRRGATAAPSRSAGSGRRRRRRGRVSTGRVARSSPRAPVADRAPGEGACGLRSRVIASGGWRGDSLHMSEGKLIRDTAEAVEGLVKAVPVYQDVVQPTAREIGEVLGRTVRTALPPLRALGWVLENRSS